MCKRSILVVFALLFFAAGGASASLVSYHAILNGASESPPNASPGTGTALVDFDDVAHLLTVNVVFSGLSAPSGNAHIHCCTAAPETGTAGVATTTPTFPGFPAGVTAGSYLQAFDLTLASSWNPSFITAHGGTPAGAEAALGAGLAGGLAYFNIHSTVFPGGEIRGFLAPVPLPGALSLLSLGMGLVLALAKRRA